MDVNTGEDMKWSNWASGEPETDEVKELNCVMLKIDGKMNTYHCSAEYCTICHLEIEPVLHLRGSCQEEGLDLDYTMKLDRRREGRHEIWGWRRTKLIWNVTKWSFVTIQGIIQLGYTGGILRMVNVSILWKDGGR